MTLFEWLRQPRTNYAPPASVLPIVVKSDEMAKHQFYLPPIGVPRRIRIFDKAAINGTDIIPATGPRQ